MPRSDLSNIDSSNRAVSELEYVIKSNKKATGEGVKEVTVQEGIKEAKYSKKESTRNVTRVLFISRDTELLNPAHQSLDGYIDISELFDEIHILILREGIPPKSPSLRVADNVWIYTATANRWWQTIGAGFDVAIDQLAFADGFRPDLVVARDPFESALIANRLEKKFGCATQLHILEDYSTPEFLQKDKKNFWRLLLPFFTIRKFESVRTLTDIIKRYIESKFSIPDLQALPRYQNYQSIIDKDYGIDLQEKYKPLIFFLVFVGKLEADSKLYNLLEVTQKLLRNPRVGMIVIGSGTNQKELEKKAKTLGLEGQVIFESKVTDPVPFFKKAHIAIVTDTDLYSEESVLKAAAAGVPLIMTKTDRRADIFVDSESGFIIDTDADIMFLQRINELMNSVGLRQEFIENGHEIIKNQFHSDPRAYLEAYRNTIEEAFFVEAPTN